MKKLKVLHVIDHLELGGAQEILVNYVAFSDEKKIRADVCVLYGRNAYRDRLKEHNVRILSENKNNLGKILYGLFKILRREPHDIVHLHLYYSKLFGRIISRLFSNGKTKIIVHEHSTIDSEFNSYFIYPAIKWMERLLYKVTDMVLCNSGYVRQFYLERLGYDADKCRILYNGIDCDSLNGEIAELSGRISENDPNNEGRLVFGFLGRLHYQKGVRELIEAFSGFVKAAPENNKHILMIAGYGPEKNALVLLVAKLRMRKNIIFVGKIKGNKRTFFGMIDCFVLPSLSEAFGIALLEALYFKTPIIASNTGGILEVLQNGKYGHLFECGNIEKLKNMFFDFAPAQKKGGQLITDMTDIGYRYVMEIFDIEIIVKQLEDIYAEIGKEAPVGLKVLHVIDHLKIGGTQKQLVMLARGLCDRGVSQRVICLADTHKQILDKFTEKGIPVHIVGRWSIYLLIGILKIAGIFKTEKPDVVHTMLFYSDMTGRFLGRLAGVGHIVSNIRARNVDKNIVQTFISKMTSGSVDHFIVNSENVVQYVTEHELNSAKDIQVIPNGIVISGSYSKETFKKKIFDKYGVNPEKVIITTSGRLVPQKGYDILLRAVKGVMREHPGVVLFVMGKGPDEKTLKGLAYEYNISKKVVFTGELENVYDVLKSSDMFVSSSRFEGMPNVVMEAMSVGLPVVATRVDGNLELIENGVNGFLVEPADPGSLEEGINRMFNSRDKWDTYSDNSRDKIKRCFSDDKMADSYYKLFSAMEKKNV